MTGNKLVTKTLIFPVVVGLVVSKYSKYVWIIIHYSRQCSHDCLHTKSDSSIAMSPLR